MSFKLKTTAKTTSEAFGVSMENLHKFNVDCVLAIAEHMYPTFSNIHTNLKKLKDSLENKEDFDIGELIKGIKQMKKLLEEGKGLGINAMEAIQLVIDYCNYLPHEFVIYKLTDDSLRKTISIAQKVVIHAYANNLTLEESKEFQRSIYVDVISDLPAEDRDKMEFGQTFPGLSNLLDSLNINKTN